MAETKAFPQTGVAYSGQLEHEYLSMHKLTVCNNCFALGFQKPLKRCNGCRLVDYCSKECQKGHWSKHKSFCNMVQGKGSRATYLTKIKAPEEVFKRLIDSYRLRTELDHAHRQEDHGVHHSGNLDGSLVWAKGGAEEDFQRYLDLAEQCGILPDWWRFEDRMECLGQAIDKANEEGIFTDINQEQLMTKYEGDTTIRNALAILAELVVGYEGKGPDKDGKWFQEFQEYLDLHPAEKAKLIEGTVEAVKDTVALTQSAN